MPLSTVAIQQFRDQFANVYQGIAPALAGTMIEFRNVVGNAYKMPQAGQIVLHDRGAYHSDIAPTIPDYVDRIVSPQHKIALVPSDIFEQTQVNASERLNCAKAAAWAISRSEDQVKMDALNASTTTNSVAVGTTNLTVDKILEAKKLLDTKNVPAQGRHWLGHAYQLNSLLKETKVTSSDYASVKALVNGDINTFLGFEFHWIGDMEEGGLYKSGDNRTNYAWHIDSMGAAYWMNPQVTIDWVPEKQSNVIIPKVSLGAGELLPPGIVKIVCDETK